MLLRWHSDERIFAKGLCMESMTSLLLFTPSSWLQLCMGLRARAGFMRRRPSPHL